MMKNNPKLAWKSVRLTLSKKWYFLVFAFISVLFFSLNVLAKNLKTLFGFLGDMPLRDYLVFFANMYKGSVANTTTFSFITLVIISVLFGTVVSLMAFRININRSLRSSINKSGTAGMMVGATAPACASCSIGLLSFIGLAGVLSYLPFKGKELGILSIGLLSYSILNLGNGLHKPGLCQIKTRGGENK
tara:strand:+ start:4416 stop:4982 length:567 start_codon:yes stop_codon:yes gene_type:complete